LDASVAESGATVLKEFVVSVVDLERSVADLVGCFCY